MKMAMLQSREPELRGDGVKCRQYYHFLTVDQRAFLQSNLSGSSDIQDLSCSVVQNYTGTVTTLSNNCLSCELISI